MSPDLTLEMILRLKSHLLSAHVELRALHADDAVLVGLLGAAEELIKVIEDWPETPEAALAGTWWRADVCWRAGLVVLTELRRLRKAREMAAGERMRTSWGKES